ncbi:FCD domain-containing protein [Martelella sp. HB161492]|uniref:FadR/GntR family transcriptional regulator n=1 Tax=Martelella sp. HB161492 TaxID=2720726 RepID=UPI0015925EDB|nr:FCD domain-containing protein [Martelella sp. HB161492]
MAHLTITPTHKNRLADSVYKQILSQITTGEFSAGDKLPSEAQLSHAFGVSRPVVREALLRLTTDGLVHSKRGIGTFVSTQPSTRLTEFADISQLSNYIRSFEPRIILEVEAARLAAQRRSLADIERISASVDQLNRAIAAGELGLEQDAEFHAAIAAACGNQYFVEILATLRWPVTSAMNIGLELARGRPPTRRMRIIEEHASILKAIAAEDSDAAASYMKYHLLQARAAVLDAQHLERAREDAPRADDLSEDGQS